MSSKSAKLQKTEPHNFTHNGDEVLILRRVPKNRTAHSGFIYPSGVGSVATAPDFNTENTCGGGLHGWPWGFGIGEGSDFDMIDDIWLVLGANPADVVGELEGRLKCKMRAGTIRYEGDFKGAMDFLRAGFAACIEAMATVPEIKKDSKETSSKDWANLAASGYDSNLAASGNDSNLAASGYASKLAASGNASKLAASGYASNLAASGNDSNLAASGNDSNLAASGNDSKLAASGYASKLAASGNDSNLAASGYASKLAASGNASKLAASGYASKLAASGNDSNLAASGYASKLAASGNDSNLAASGYASKLAASGNDSCAAVAAHGGKVQMGERGAFALAYWDDKTGWEFVTGKVGRDGIKAGSWYQVVNGKLVEI